MTTMCFNRFQNRIKGFSCQGHSGYSDEGTDIVCAAVTSAVRLAECILNDVLHANAAVFVNEKDAEISLSISDASLKVTDCEAVLYGLYLYACELSQEYPEYFKVTEV